MPPLRDATDRWLSAHLFFEADRRSVYGSACDRVMLEVVEPFVRRCQEHNWITRYFFIRYSERGPHVRLRLAGEADVLERIVQPALEKHVDAALPAEIRGYPHLTPDIQEQDGASPMRWIPYEPEVNRYGGAAGVRLAERFFHASSEAAIALLQDIHEQDRSARLGKGMLSMIVLLHTFLDDREDAARFVQRYGTGYLRALVRKEEHRDVWRGAFDRGFDRQSETISMYAHELWKRMDTDAPLPAVLDEYRHRLHEIREALAALQHEGHLVKNETVATRWDQSVGMVVPSYLHMMNNRLGIAITEESYLAHLIARALSEPAERAA